MARESWTPVTLVKTTAEYLTSKQVPTPKLDAELLLVHALRLENRVQLYTQHDRPLTEEELATYRMLVRRRADREPVSRILGETEFMGMTMMVPPGVFAPRPETEILVEEAIKLIRPPASKSSSTAEATEIGSTRLKKISTAEMGALEEDQRKQAKTRVWSEGEDITDADGQVFHDPELRDPKRILELGTGSGCIAISLVLFCRDAYVAASDINPAALTIARENADPHPIWERIDFREGDLFDVCWPGEQFDMIVSNPPYLAKGDPEIWPEVKNFDPPEALYGGIDGLDFYRCIAAEALDWLKPDGYILVEVGAGQHETVMDLFGTAGLSKLRTLKDHAGIDRVVIGRHTE